MIRKLICIGMLLGVVCAAVPVLASGEIYGWGSGAEVSGALIGPVEQIAAGSSHNLGLKSDGSIAAWG